MDFVAAATVAAAAAAAAAKQNQQQLLLSVSVARCARTCLVLSYPCLVYL